jgi:hypothetical protein
MARCPSPSRRCAVTSNYDAKISGLPSSAARMAFSPDVGVYPHGDNARLYEAVCAASIMRLTGAKLIHTPYPFAAFLLRCAPDSFLLTKPYASWTMSA